MKLSESQVVGLQSLGEELRATHWMPRIPLAEGFETSEPDPDRDAVRLALAFLRQYDPQIRGVICHEGQCRSEIRTATEIIAGIGDSLAAANNFPVPVFSISKALVAYGIDAYCAGI